MIRLKSLKSEGIKKLDIPGENDFERLEFPEEGEILIHGLNESGKSTLFESIYFALFGTALIPDRSTSSMSQLLNYDREEAEVELEFYVDKTLYRVNREIKKRSSGMDYTHRLEIERPSGNYQEFRGKKDVNSQIQEELGLDGDSMLNSCFVEQKNLDRLEDSSKASREKSISTLLNLDRFTEMEEEYSQEMDELEDLMEEREKKLEISRLENEEIPRKEEKLGEVRSRIRILSDREEIGEKREEIQKLEDEIDELEEKEDKLPEKEQLLDKLEELHGDLKERAEYQERRDKVEELEEEREELEENIEEWREELEELEPEYEKLKKRLGDRKYADLLEDWARLYRAAYRQEKLEDEREELGREEEDKKEELEEKREELDHLKHRRRKGLAASGLIGAISLIGGFLGPAIVFSGLVLSAVLALYFVLSLNIESYREAVSGLEDEIDSIEREVERIEAKQETIDLSPEEASQEIESVESEIQGMQRLLPGDDEKAMEVLDELGDPGKESELRDEIQDVRDRIQELKQKMEDRQERIEEIEEELVDYDREEISERLEVLDEAVDEKIAEARGIARELEKDFELVEDPEEINSIKSGLLTEIENDRDEVDRIEELENHVEELEGDIEALESDIDEGKAEWHIKSIERDREELEELRDDLMRAKGGLEKRLEDLKKEVDYSGKEVEEAEEKLEEARNKRKEIEYAEGIVERSKKSIMEQVLPKTEANMARFLPILTNGRYKDVSIDSEDFQIEVYDSEAGDLKEKSVFSGGTRDQFSLALRLSFAMATLPQEKGSAPDFLFLDEPVGAFDSERKEALTELLTRGEIAENFSQIFVISHVEDLKEEFSKHIEMRDGEIVNKRI
jgi:exonuclease SbcC